MAIKSLDLKLRLRIIPARGDVIDIFPSQIKKLRQMFCVLGYNFVLFNPTSHGVSDFVAPMGEGPQRPAPPKKSRKESFLTPCCYIAFFTWYI